MNLNNLDSLQYFLPEIVLTVTILAIAVIDLVLDNKKGLPYVATAGIILSLWTTTQLYGMPQGWLFHRMIVLDNFSLFFKVVSLIAVFLVVWMSVGSTSDFQL